MITKINSHKPITANASKLKTSCCRPTFTGKDEFFKGASVKPLPEAISYILNSISLDKFSSAQVLFVNTDKQVLLNDLCIQAEKVKRGINVAVTYNHPNVSGSIPLASGSAEEVKKVLTDKDFTKKLIKKLREASDDELFGKTERFDD